MKRLLWSLSLVLALTLPNSGCLFSNFDPSGVGTVSVYVEESINPEIVAKIQKVSVDITKEDKERLRKVFLGASSFVQSAVPSTTINLYDHFTKVELIYDYKKEKYKAFSDVFEEIMRNPAYTGKIDLETPQKIGDVRQYLVTIFESIGRGLE